MLGLSVQSDDATPGLIAYLRDKRILLILDTCEHLVEAVAALAASIIEAAPQVHILATSREALRVEGEHVYRLDALACPPDAPGLTAAAVQQFPATQLFVERAVASGARLDLSDAEASIVAGICRKLDGVALAIELAARRVESYGLQQTAALLDQRLTLLWQGSRTAPPRQKTLQATLDWSYGLLSDVERVGASPARRIRRTFYARCGAGRRHQRDARSIGCVWRDRQPRRQVDGGHPPDRRDDALPAPRHDARLRPRNQHRRRRGRRPGRAPRDLLPAMAGADRGRMADPVDRHGAGAVLCRSQQCPRGAGMVLWRQRQHR